MFWKKKKKKQWWKRSLAYLSRVTLRNSWHYYHNCYCRCCYYYSTTTTTALQRWLFYLTCASPLDAWNASNLPLRPARSNMNKSIPKFVFFSNRMPTAIEDGLHHMVRVWKLAREVLVSWRRGLFAKCKYNVQGNSWCCISQKGVIYIFSLQQIQARRKMQISPWDMNFW